MRKWINLSEKWALTLPKTLMSGRDADIFVNPTRTEFAKLIKSWGESVCRAGIGKNGDLYVWRMDDAFHDEVQERSGVDMAPVSLMLHWPEKVVWWAELSYWHPENGGPYDEETKTEGLRILGSRGIASLYGNGWTLVGEDDDGHFTMNITPQWLDSAVAQSE